MARRCRKGWQGDGAVILSDMFGNGEPLTRKANGFLVADGFSEQRSGHHDRPLGLAEVIPGMRLFMKSDHAIGLTGLRQDRDHVRDKESGSGAALLERAQEIAPAGDGTINRMQF